MNKLLKKGSLLVLFAGALLSAGTAMGETVYQLESSGRDEKAATGNLKMTALRECVKKMIPEDDLRSNARVLRTEIFMKADEFVTLDDSSLKISEKSGKYVVTGTAKVNDEAVMARLAQIPELNELIVIQHPESPAAADTSGHTSSSSGESANSDSQRDNSHAGTAGMNADGFMELVASSDAGNAAKIKKALKDGMNPDARYEADDGQPYGDPAFCVYLMNGNRDIEVVKAFVAAGANVLITDTNGYHKTLYQVFSSSNEIIETVLEGLNPDLRDVRFESKGYPLLVFLENRENVTADMPKIIDKIMALGGDLNRTDSGGVSAVIYAIVNGKLDMLKLLMEKGGDLKKAAASPMPALYGDDSRTVYQNITENEYSDAEMAAMKEFLIKEAGQ